MGAMADCSTTASYVGWEEVVVCNEKGRRQVHYYLKRGGGGADLVVVGKERSVRHMSYRYVKEFCNKENDSFESILSRCSMPKLRSRREVIDWLNSVVSGLDEAPNCSLSQFEGDLETKLDANLVKLGTDRTEFMWLGSPWTCRKRRRHYQSFCRNGFILSVHDFVYVLAEENKRLVAYLDDVYEDSRGNKMAVVRWFHKIDEVGFVLPHIYNDREIFFSLCLQDLSIECIDGLVTVLSPEHYEKFSHEATRAGLVVFVCNRLFDNDDVKPFDITTIKGYWKQAVLRNTSSAYEPSDCNTSKGSFGDAIECRPGKRIRWSKECLKYLDSDNKNISHETNLQDSLMTASVKGVSPTSSSGRDESFETRKQYLTIGSQVEVLSQDSGIRGCWFRALIIKEHKKMFKVQYQDIKDAADDAKNLEEWVLASRIAAPDDLGIRVPGRTIVRPIRSAAKGKYPSVFGVGSIVDAWWHDGWWEGIVVKEEKDRLHVYFPGERQEQMFGPGNLRHSQEWFENEWRIISRRPDLLSKISGNETTPIKTDQHTDVHQNAASSGVRDVVASEQDNLLQESMKYGKAVDDKVQNETEVVRDLSRDDWLAKLKWKASGKRSRVRSPVHKFHCASNSDYSGLQTFFADSSLKFVPDNWEYSNHFNSSVVPPLANLVMSS